MKTWLKSIGISITTYVIPCIIMIALLSFIGVLIGDNGRALFAFSVFACFVLLNIFIVHDELTRKRIVNVYSNDLLFHFIQKKNKNPEDVVLNGVVQNLKKYVEDHQKEVEAVYTTYKEF